jgi:hypothetical protein
MDVSKYSKSPDRNSFYKNSLKKQLDEQKVSQEYYDAMIKILDEEDERQEQREKDGTIQYSLEHDLRSNQTILDKCRNSQVYSQNLYAALCNNDFYYGEHEWGCSWRYAGGIIADILQKGDYIDWYCSGIGTDPKTTPGYVGEGVVTDEIKLDLIKIGWIVKPCPDN